MFYNIMPHRIFFMPNRHLSFVLLKQPVLHALDAIRHEPCGAVVAARKMYKELMVVLATHFVGFF